MGLPVINISFLAKARNAIERSAKGIVACIIKDDTKDIPELQSCTTINDIDFTKMSAANYGYMKLLFDAAPARVLILAIPTEAADYAVALKKLKDLKWNYLTIPEIDSAGITAAVAWIKEQRDSNHKPFKAVLPKISADHKGIINCTIDNVTSTITEGKLSAAAYCARLAGIFAAIPLTRSSTYYTLPDIIQCDVPEDPDTAIDSGQLIAIYDGEKYKIARGVNSLTTIEDGSSKDMQKIKIIEGLDLISEDIRTTFEDDYVGKVRNSYDKKQEFVAAVNNYYRTILGEILDENSENSCQLDITAQKQYLDENGTDTSKMTDVQIAEANTGSRLFISSTIHPVDAMEDLDMVNYM